jgi:hypothetical protein
MGIIPSLQNIKEEVNLQFQMEVLQLIANINHLKPNNFSNQPLPMHSQPASSISTHVGRNNPSLV